MKTSKPFLRKLPAQYAAWIIPLILSCLMSGTLSFANLLMNLGFSTALINQWLSTWMVSWVIAYPLVLIFLPLVRRLTSLIVEMPPH
ncbi:DUF2798 domain-containing protein [Acinetobacter sp. YK3]|uniref:DUF2798 domain-containing protein n=1 Tax=Acinetobacter sp. YK3 TaxID=1860097 RepID=UPI001D0D1CF7|nr:DUF2798 domain-containing protein [Acinetobacter sp. YK3]